MAEWEARQLGRARLCPVPATDVLDWEVDEYGSLLWVLTTKKEVRRDDPRLERQLVTETFKLYDRQEVETFQIVYDPKKRPRLDDQIPSVSKKPHGFDRVPLIEMRLPEGLWLMNREADAQIEHFRLSAAQSWAIKRTCYPMAIFKCAAQDKPPKAGPGNLQMIGLEESFEWVAPDAAPFETIGKEIEAQRTEIYRIANQMAASVNNSSAALGRSGESKQADSAATEVCLKAYPFYTSRGDRTEG